MKSKAGFGKEIITKSSEQTQKAGEKFAESLLLKCNLDQGVTLIRKGIVVAFYGELGSGKTTFVQGMAKGFGINRRILSPTFTLIREQELNIKYPMSNSKFQIKKRLYHVDLYRIQGEQDIKGLGLEEIISDPENVVVIEWAEKMGNLLPKDRIDIHFRYLDENRRQIVINKLT